MEVLKSLSNVVRYVGMYAYHLLAFPLIAAGCLAWLCTSVLGPVTLQSPFFWIAGAPVLYLCWLLLTFAVSALNMQIAGRLGWRKPARSISTDGDPSTQQIVCAAIMMRAILFWSLPVARYFLRIPVLSELVLYSYSSKVSVGRGTQIWGYIYDPDLTTLGDHSILGGGATVCSHSVTTDQDGRMVYSTAPVVIGPRAIIGGESRIGLGVQIGADAIVEPGSIVSAFTHIPDGEVWAGNPARFQRHRFDSQPAQVEPGSSLDSEEFRNGVGVGRDCRAIGVADIDALREIISDNLRIPLEALSESPSAREYCEWDSLAQMGIASAIAAQFGCVLPAEDVFQLTSLDRICAVVFPPSDGSEHHGVECDDHGHLQQSEREPVLSACEDPELLPLRARSTVNQMLARPQRTGSLHDCRASVRIASSFTVEPVEASVLQWCGAFGITADVTFAGFDQVEQSLLLPGSVFRTNEAGVNVVLVRPEDLVGKAGRLESLLAAIKSFGGSHAGSLIVGTLPPVVSSFCQSDRSDVDEMRARWRNELRSMSHVELLDFSAVIERIGTEAARQTDMEVVARSPYSVTAFQEVGIELSRHLRARFRPAKKVLALDADNTLWGGVIGEDGIDGIQLGDDHPGRSFKLFQQQILRLKNQGILLALVSRNEERDVLEVLNEHPEMLLKRQDFASSRINWQRKSENLKALATELNLGLDAFVFVDDDPANRAEVEENASGVTVLPLPADPTRYCETLGALWCFDSVAVSAEDQARTEMMHQQRERDELRNDTKDQSDYLASLQLRATMRPATERELPRVAQLTQKTNQFNLSLRRRSLDEIRVLAREARIFVVSAADRFGDYGLIGVVILRHDGLRETLEIDTFLLSCRALGRGIEQLMLQETLSLADRAGLSGLDAPFEIGPRNQPVRDFFKTSGLQMTDTAYVGSTLDFDVPESVTWSLSDGHESADLMSDVA